MRFLLDFARRITGWESQEGELPSGYIIDCVNPRPEELHRPPKPLRELEGEAKIIAEQRIRQVCTC